MSMRASVYLDFKTAGVAETRRAFTGIVNESRKAADAARKAAEVEKAAARAKAAAERAAAREKTAAARNAARQEATIAKASAKTAADQAKAKAAAEKAAQRTALDAVRAAERLKREEVKRTSNEAKQLAQAEARWRQRMSRDTQREIARGRREQARQQRDRQQRQQRDSRDHADLAGTIGMGVIGTGMAVAGAALAFGAEDYQRSRAWIGLEDEDAIVGRYGQTHLQFQNTADQSRGQRSTAELEALGMRGAEQFGIAPETTSEMFANIQDMYSDQADAVVEHFDRINEISAAYQANLGGVAESGSIVMRDLGVTQDQMDDALQAMAGSTGSGSVSMGDLSTQFGSIPNLLKATFGEQSTGLVGAQQFAALAQISGRSGVQGDERATTLSRFLQELKDPETRRRLREATNGRVNIEGRDGQLLPMRDVLQRLMSPELDRPGVTEDVFQSIPAQTYLRGLRTGGIETYDRLLSESTPEAGSEMIASRMSNLRNDTAYQARLAAGRQAATVYRQAPGLINRSLNQTGYITDWEAANVGMSPMIRTPLAAAANAAEMVGSALFGNEQRQGMSRSGVETIDPRILFRELLGGDVEQLDAWRSNATFGEGPIIGQSVGAANASSVVNDIVRQTLGAFGQTPQGGRMREEVADPIVRALDVTATRIEGAVTRIQPAGANVGSSTEPTAPTRTR